MTQMPLLVQGTVLVIKCDSVPETLRRDSIETISLSLLYTCVTDR